MEISANDFRNGVVFKHGVAKLKTLDFKIKKPAPQKNIEKEKKKKQSQVCKQTEIPLNENRELHEYFIEIKPNTKPRMTKSDKWKNDPNHEDPRRRQRKPVTQYFCYKNKLIKLCGELGIENIPASIYTLKFYFRMPESWSNKKKERMMGQLHQQTPDIDNIMKALFDSLQVQDNYIAEVTNGLGKYWSDKDGILLII